MAIYRIKTEQTYIINYNGKTEKESTVKSYNDIVTGNMSDVAKVMLKAQKDFLTIGTIKNTNIDHLRTLFVSKDSLQRILEIGACYTQIGNEILKSVHLSSLLQICERIR